MPSPHERTRNNVRVGVFVSTALILSLAVVSVLTDVLDEIFTPTHDYEVTFSVASGISDLQIGSEVRVGGVIKGRVSGIEAEPIATGELRDIVVTFAIEEDLKLFSDAKILIKEPLIGGGAWIDIPNVGSATAGEPANGQIQGSAAVGMLTAMLGAESAGRTTEIIENTRQFTEYLSSADTKIDPIISNVETTTEDLKGLMANVRHERWPRWAESIDHVMTWANGATERLDAALAEGHGLLADTREVVAENRQPIRSIFSNTEQATMDAREMMARANEEVVDKVVALLDTGQVGLDQAVAAVIRIREDYEGWSVNLGETLANATLASQQLKLASIEVRRSPWKMMYRPQADELEHELLYETVRAFAMAATDLKAASTSVQHVLDQHGDRLQDQDVERIRENLLDSMGRYESAQERLFDVLITDAPQGQ